MLRGRGCRWSSRWSIRLGEKLCGSGWVVSMGSMNGKVGAGAHGDEDEDCVEDVEQTHCSGLVLHWGFSFHLELEADCETDEDDDE
jgi:hypothetical protein